MFRKNEYKKLSAETKRFLDGQEGRNIDFKLGPGAISTEDIVAFANSGGGTILAGVSEIKGSAGIQRGKVEGCNIDDKTRQAIIGKASSCRPALDVHIQIENSATNSPILRIDIPDGKNKPYSTSSGTYKIRSEGRNLAIDPPLIKAMILQSEADEFVKRLKHAADELVQEMDKVKIELSTQIQEVKSATEAAIEAARFAESAAQNAADAAYEAASAAEDSAMDGFY